MVRLLAVDIDGTLVSDDAPCSPRNKEALGRAIEAGVEVVLVTARPWQSAVPVAHACGLSGTAICSLGAVAYDLTRGEVSELRPLSRSAVADAVEVLRGLSSDIVFGWATAEALRSEDRYPLRGGLETGEICAEEAPVVHLFARHLSSDGAWIGIAVEFLGRSVETAQWSSGVLDITATGVTKLAMLQEHCLRRDITAHEVVAIGDTAVDVPMMQWAQTGIAVGDAAQEVREAADMVVAACADDAVAEAIGAVLPRH